MKPRLLIFLALLDWILLGTTGRFEPWQRDAGPGKDDTELIQNDEERESWLRVARARTGIRGLAEQFLDRFPESEFAAQAHYLVATQAFADQDFQSFVESGELSAAGLPRHFDILPRQKLRWWELLSRLAFYYAETGQDEAAERHAQRVLQTLQVPQLDTGLDQEQWNEFRRRQSASANYALGRLWLGRAGKSKNSPDPASVQKSVDYFQEALRLNPADDYSWLRLARALAIQGRGGESREALGRSAALGGAAASVALQALKSQLDSPQALLEAVSEGEEDLTGLLERAPRVVYALPDGRPHPLYWWDSVPPEVRQAAAPPPSSNVRREDYAGPESCRPCHSEKYDGWSKHAHRWMNAWASRETVKGDFEGGASLEYRGGKAWFEARDGSYRMRLARGGVERVYRIERTIGSRFFQYYIGKLVKGPEPGNHPVRRIDHVLPFGYWLDEQQWVPIVHIDEEVEDEAREDPFSGPSRIPYDLMCSACHTTRPFGDWMLRTDGRIRLGEFSPREVSIDMGGYIRESHPEMVNAGGPLPTRELDKLFEQFDSLPAREHAVVLGVSCEACHNGAKAHVENSTERETKLAPQFFPSSPYVLVKHDPETSDLWGRTSENRNWICGRCHSGGRPRFAGGMDTWNSTEYSDAARGPCFDRERATAAGKQTLTCVTCHDPHFTIGKKWSRPPDQDDAKCLGCHEQYAEPSARNRHTQHKEGSEGSRCLNCHMPRINEGIQEVVRTHQIFSPTNPAMIESNQPNACNLCHLEKPIDWTLGFLKQWYGDEFDETRIQKAYPDRKEPVGTGWLRSPHEPTRLVAASALTQSGARWAMDELVQMLDDPFLLNRQFTQRGLEKMLNLKLSGYGYRFYQSKAERQRPLKKIRDELLGEKNGQ